MAALQQQLPHLSQQVRSKPGLYQGSSKRIIKALLTVLWLCSNNTRTSPSRYAANLERCGYLVRSIEV